MKYVIKTTTSDGSTYSTPFDTRAEAEICIDTFCSAYGREEAPPVTEILEADYFYGTLMIADPEIPEGVEICLPKP